MNACRYKPMVGSAVVNRPPGTPLLFLMPSSPQVVFKTYLARSGNTMPGPAPGEKFGQNAETRRTLRHFSPGRAESIIL